MKSDTLPELPPLPEPEGVIVVGTQALRGFTADQMHAYAMQTSAEVQGEQEADGLPPIVAGAIFDFAGFMTTRSEVIEVGSTAEAGPVADLVKEWAESRGLDLANAAVLSWQLHITRASLPATGEPVGYMNDGHLHELAMRRLPYGYVYPEAGAGASTAVYTHPAPSMPATPEPVLTVEKEPDYWASGHFYEGNKPYINPTKVWHLPIGTKLYTHPSPCEPSLIEKAISSGCFGVLPVKATIPMCKAGWAASGGELTFQQIGHIYEEMYKARPLPDAAIYAAPSVPDGWVLMPRELTPDEAMKGQGALLDMCWDATTCFVARYAELIHATEPRRAAMLAA